MSGGALAVFWASVALVGWPWAGFPLLLALRALRPAPRPRTTGPLPRVSVVIAVHNEAAVIGRKLANLGALAYPRDRLQVIVVSDGSDDGTCERVARHSAGPRIELLELPRVGKNAALNAGVAAASGEVLVFSDADTLLERDALERLVAPFADPAVGGVAGDFRYGGEGDDARGERDYWDVDRLWRRLESRAGSVTSATGQLYAIRREHFTPVPDGVTDDFYVSTGVIEAGTRLWYEPRAVAWGPPAAAVGAEYRRKVRLVGRGFASVWRRRRLLDPRRTGFYALQLASHKVLRRLAGLPLLAAAISAPLLWDLHPVYRVAAVGQLAFHGLALVGWLARDRRFGRSRPFSLPLYFDMAHLAALQAFGDFLRGRSRRSWDPGRAAAVERAPVAGAERGA